MKWKELNFLYPVGTDIPVSQAPSVLGFETGCEALGIPPRQILPLSEENLAGFLRKSFPLDCIACLSFVGKIPKYSSPS